MSKSFVISILSEIGAAVKNKIGSNPTENSGATFSNEVFSMNAYCWCDGVNEDHEKNGCPVNFLYKKTDFTASWYKHINRDFHSDDISRSDLIKMMNNCINSIS